MNKRNLCKMAFSISGAYRKRNQPVVRNEGTWEPCGGLIERRVGWSAETAGTWLFWAPAIWSRRRSASSTRGGKGQCKRDGDVGGGDAFVGTKAKALSMVLGWHRWQRSVTIRGLVNRAKVGGLPNNPLGNLSAEFPCKIWLTA